MESRGDCIMAIDFPNSPATNELYTTAGKTWKYDGEKWQTVDTATNTQNQMYDMIVMMRMETN
jgi:hypothetical protein